jgi:4-hydroxy-4-methyl-2-oxoglutarate aldolase
MPEELRMLIENPRAGDTVDQSVLEALMGLSPSTLGHMTDFGFVRRLHPISRPLRLVGPALTVKIPHMDSTAVHCALDLVQPGDVVGDEDRASWGGAVSYAAAKKGVAGALVDGGLTDYSEVVELGLPVFYRAITALTTRILGLEGAINVPVTVGGVAVTPGDIVFADENGAAILAPHDCERLAQEIAEKEAGEVQLKARLDKGESLATLSSARALFDAGAVSLPPTEKGPPR